MCLLIQRFFLIKTLANVVSYEYTIASVHPNHGKKLRTCTSHVPYFYAHQPLELAEGPVQRATPQRCLKHERRRKSSCDTAFAVNIKCL